MMISLLLPLSIGDSDSYLLALSCKGSEILIKERQETNAVFKVVG
jgi:hypothetical protein